MGGLSIGSRLALWYGFAVGLILCAVGVAAWVGARSSIYQTLDEELTYRLDLVIQRVKTLPLRSSSVATVRARLKSDMDLLPGSDLLQICDETGNWLYLTEYGSHALPSCTEVDRSPQPNSFRTYWPWVRVLAARVQIGQGIYVIRLGSSVEVFEKGLERLRYSLLLSILAGLILACAVGFWMSKRALAPVDAIITTANSISAENLSKRLVVPKTGDELQRLSKTLNEMMERLDLAFAQLASAYKRADAAYKAVTQFTADASHELRTPVAVMRAKAEVCLQRPRDTEKYKSTLLQILQELERFSRRIEDLMLLSRADSGQAVVRTLPLSLNKSMEDACREAQALAESFDIEFEFELPDQDIAIQGDDEAIRRLFLILINNALKYTRPGGRVSVTLRDGDGFALADVSDTGIGIPEEDLPHIFERFYRVDRVRSRTEGGVGLGLAIARTIAEAHHGAIDVRSTHEQGSTFTVRLPMLLDPESGTDPSEHTHPTVRSASRGCSTAA